MFSVFLDFIFPPACVTCDEIGGYICRKCYDKMHFYTQPVTIDISHPSLDKLYACTTYNNSGGDFIKTFKFGGAYALAEPISTLMKRNLQISEEVDLLIPVPLHKKRESERGFNQAQLIAKHLSRYWKKPLQLTLQRTKATTPQAQLDREKRLNHLQGVFECTEKISVAGKTIALVDDVSTTGTTLNECAKILKKHHAKQVIGVVFAHG